jgi:hypothetical protein
VDDAARVGSGERAAELARDVDGEGDLELAAPLEKARQIGPVEVLADEEGLPRRRPVHVVDVHDVG